MKYYTAQEARILRKQPKQPEFPIGCMGLAYLPISTWMVDIYGKMLVNIPYMDPMIFFVRGSSKRLKRPFFSHTVYSKKSSLELKNGGS